MSQTIERPPTDASERAIQGLLALVFLMVDSPVAIITARTGEEGSRVVMTNPAFDRRLGLRPGASSGSRALLSIAPADHPRVIEALALQDTTLRSFTLNLALLHISGVEIPTVLTCVLPPAPELRRFRIITLPIGAQKEAEPDQVVAGKVRLVSLAEIRALMADEWTAVAHRILSIARGVIEERLGPQDTLRATADLGFVIVFADMTEAEASARCTTIGREIRRALIRAGEDASTVEVAATAIRIPAPASDAALDASFAAVEPPATRQPVRAAFCRFDAVQGCRRGEFIGWSIAFSAAAMPANPALGALAPRLQDRLDRVLKGAERQGNQADSRQSGERLFLDIDFAAFATRASAERLLETCAQLEPGVRGRLTFLLSGVPSGVPSSRMGDIAAQLSPLCQTLGLALPDLAPPGFDLALLRTPVVAVDAAGWGEVPQTRIGRLAQAVHLKRGQLLVRGIASIEIARQMRSLGVDFVACAAAMPPAA